MRAERLYTPQMLSAAVELANYPPIDNACLRGSARSAVCGSTLDMDLVLHANACVERIGMKVRACAVGQAAAAVFARHAADKSQAQIAAAYESLSAWLEEEGPAPTWPEIILIAPARDYPARHGAILLPWKAALDALSSAGETG